MKINPFKLERFFAKYEFKAQFMLGSSDCESLSIKEILELEPDSEQNFLKTYLGYTESEGLPLLREEIAKLYQKVDSPHIFCFAGAQEAIFNFMNTLLNPGDHIIVQFPAYQSLYEVAYANNCEVTKWPMIEDNNWELDLDFLETNIKTNTKAIIVNTPNNPTGAHFSQEHWKKLIEIARSHNLILFSDEVYRFLELDPNDHLTPACDLYENAISLGVMSKSFGLAGLRIGWIATQNDDLLRYFKEFKDFTTICNSAPSEILALIALRNKEKLLKRNLSIVRSNLQLLDEFFLKNKNMFQWIRPKAGSIGFVRLKNNVNSEDFCIDIVEHTGVLLVPSTLFNFGPSHFRIGFGRKNLPVVLKHFEQFLEKKKEK
ncbi:aminotransferase class I/II-fold pyridoxal phosphate-dependent enzyme [Promethearchaeum syntrophicum]|uniref:Aminotransferase class I/II-fold pyridoxal phosphate-dependent enzyme n=1 Tax=Promethearchaeum syntrophicum TaxID=2594042 RepID=A0A5B9D565_9ARCH|nr:aminotransferase class I/II-fold pyridoxal phosphate-dependent enzyme [Candidatus Prometheoarchaeum syntrophicum]QEE14192.1 Aspartate aminotransferase [Candidatus Prometheoarchaeum syntrophicum]